MFGEGATGNLYHLGPLETHIVEHRQDIYDQQVFFNSSNLDTKFLETNISMITFIEFSTRITNVSLSFLQVHIPVQEFEILGLHSLLVNFVRYSLVWWLAPPVDLSESAASSCPFPAT